MSARILRTNVLVLLSFLMLLTSGCNWFDGDDSPREYTVGGTVTGLTDQLTLQNNGAGDLVIAADGIFEFATPMNSGTGYAVTVSSQPDGQSCTVTNAAGNISAADVTNVEVSCVDLFTGLFVDDLVLGLDYTCSSGTSSETTAGGQFTCPEGDDITFWLGSNELGPVPVAYTIISPLLLFSEDGIAAINLARLLQSLDSDLLPDNGVIVIDDALVADLPENIDFSLQPAEFEAAVGMSLVSLETAVQRLSDAIAQYVPGNIDPIANAGADRDVIVGATVTLSGAGSSDANGDGLTFNWTFVSTPEGSSAQLASRFTVAPSFVADVAGPYVIGVLVSDGTVINYDIVVVTANDGSALPAAPQGLQAVAGDALVALSWNAVDGATGYMIYWNTTGNVATSDNWTGPLTSTVINLGSLTNGTTYYYRVAAVNTSGEGPLSAEASATPEAPGTGLPAMPEGVQALAGDSLVTLNWTAVSGATSYTVYWNNTGGVDDSDASLAAGGNPGFTHTGLTNGTTYYYRVAASNASGESPLSAERSAAPVAATPTPPAAPQGVQATAGDTEVTIAWTTVSGADSYTVYWNNTGGVTTANSSIAPGGATQIIHSGLTNDTQYFYRVSASNTGGEGALSAEVSATPAAQSTEPPAQPQGFQIIPGDSQLTLVWDAVDGADSYVINWREVGVTGYQTIPVDGGTTQYVHTGLTNGATYSYFLEARNAAGSGPVTATLSGVPAIPKPFNIAAIAGNGQTLLSWDLAELAGVNFTVYWSTTENVTTSDNSIDAGTDLQIAHTGLTAGKDYYYRVSATSTSGESELSAEVSSSQLSNWQWASPKPHGNSFNKVIWGNNEFIAVADAGGIYTSPGGATWESQKSGTSRRLYGIAWSGSRYAAVGEDGLIVTSKDALVWSVRSAEMNHSDFLDVIWNGSRFVATGSTIITSEDGVTWTEANHSATSFIRALSWNDDLLVAFEGGATNYIHTSTDGMNWTAHTTAISNIRGIVWNGSQFVALSYAAVHTSINGVDWAEIGSPNSNLVPGGIIWDGGQFVGSAAGGLMVTSLDGVNWTSQTTDTTESVNSVAFYGGQYVAVGWTGLILTSTDAATWSQLLPTSAASRLSLGDVVWGGGQFVAVGGYGSSACCPNSSVILTSPDGDTWTVRTSGLTSPIQSIIWTGSQFVAASRDGIITSNDGETWTIRHSGGGGNSIAWTGSKFVVVGGYRYVLTSDDAITWTSHAISSTVGFNAVEWNGEKFVAVGGYTGGYNVMTSLDGENWTFNANVFPRLDDVIWANNQFVAAAFERTLTSDDGLTWTTHYMSDPSGYMIEVEWDGTQYVACSADGPIHTSPDGANWTRQNTASGNWLESIAWDTGGKAVGVGLSSTILTNSSW